MRYFEQYCEESGLIEPKRAPRKNITAEKVLQMLQECEAFLKRQTSVSFWYKAKSTVLYGLFEWNYYKNDISDIVTYLLKLYYRIRHTELKQEIRELEQFLSAVDAKKKMDQLTNAIFASYKLPIGYSYSDNSFLKSVCSVIPEIPQTLLREHYRCHPKIIGFCNQKFYNGELVIMTEDHGENDTLSVYRTAVGDHRRGHVNQRQIDVTMKEVLPAFSDTEPENIGIIAPYRHQVEAMAAALENSRIETDTVHKFQGREKDVILLTTGDDEITEFSDDPYLLNVAISRAKKKLCLVTSGNEQPKDSNIQDLISYIEYNNFSVVNSELYSVFDLLYQQYTAQRIVYLEKHKKVSEYDSENLMYAALIDLLGRHLEVPLNVIVHQSVRFPTNGSGEIEKIETVLFGEKI